MKLEASGWTNDIWKLDGVSVQHRLVGVELTDTNGESFVVSIVWGYYKQEYRDHGASGTFDVLEPRIKVNIPTSPKHFIESPLVAFIEKHNLTITDGILK